MAKKSAPAKKTAAKTLDMRHMGKDTCKDGGKKSQPTPQAKAAAKAKATKGKGSR
jgi:hypothetical protein